MKINANDWHKSFHDRELVEATPLTAEQRGCWYTIRNLIFKEMGHVINDDAHLAGHCRMKMPAFAKVKARLLAVGCLYVEGTSLRSKSCDTIIAERMAKRRKARNSGRLGGKAKAERERTKGNYVNQPAKSREPTEEPAEDPQLFEEPEGFSNRYTGADDGFPVNSEGNPVNFKNKAHSTGRGQAGQVPEKPQNPHSSGLANATNSLAESKNQESKKVRKKKKESEVDDFIADAVEEAIDAYNAAAGINNDWPKVETRTPKRRRSMGRLLNSEGTGGLDGWRAMLKRASESDWLAGRTKRGPDHRNWRASLDYFVRLDVFVEVMEGRHDNRTASGSSENRRRGTEAMGEALGRFLEDDSS